MGMRVKFKDVECFRDYVYEYEDGEGEYNMWKAEEHVTPEKKNAVVEELPLEEIEADAQTDYWASLMNIRSHKKTGNATSGKMELLDLSEFDYLDDLTGENEAKKNFSDSEKTSNSSDSELNSTPHTVTDAITFSEGAVNNTITASWNESLSINTTEATPLVSSVNDTQGDSINSTHMPFNNTWLTTAVPLLASPSETPVPLAVQDDPLPSFNSSVNETESGYTQSNNTADWFESEINTTVGPKQNASLALVDPNMTLSNTTEVPDLVRNDTESSQNITAEWSMNSNNTEQVFSTPETPLESATEGLNVTETEVVLLDGDAPTDIGVIEEEAGSNTFGSLYDIIINPAPTEGIADDILSPGDLLVVNVNDTEIGTVSGAFKEMDNETLPQVRVEVMLPPRFDSAEIGEILPIDMSSSENSQNISSNSSSSDSSEWAPVNASHPSKAYGNSSQESEEDWTSSEEVVIYLKHNTSEGIKTNPLGHPKEHWGYEGKHEPIPMDIPEDMTKYVQNETKPKKEPKKTVVHRRVRPFKGHAMKTRKRKEYKPQPRSSLSHRGFQPRGARPISSEEDILNKAIVIGVRRTEFSDYDLFAVPEDSQDVQDSKLSQEEYEYIEYKDPYSGSLDTVGMTLDETTKYFLKHVAKGTNVRQYFLSAEEVEWDYSGYGQR